MTGALKLPDWLYVRSLLRDEYLGLADIAVEDREVQRVPVSQGGAAGERLADRREQRAIERRLSQTAADPEQGDRHPYALHHRRP